MKFLSTIICLSCVIVVVVKASELITYCYDSPELSCTEKHVLKCKDDHVITTGVSNFGVGFLKNKNFSECRSNAGECKNKTTCCRNINSSVTKQVTRLTAYNTSNPVIDFIKTNCSSKSSCTVKNYNNNNYGPDKYDFVNYYYGCIPAKRDNITVDFMVNGSTKFTGNNSLSLYYLDYTGTKGDNNVKLNRECVVSTTTSSMTLTIKKLNLQVGDCCRFQISRFNVSEYCSENGSIVPIGEKFIDGKKATIKLEHVTYKDGDKFSILIEAAGNVTVECKTIEDVNRQNSTTCEYPKPTTISLITNSSSISSTTNNTPGEGEFKGMDDSETNLAGIVGGTVVVLVVLVTVIIVVVVIVRRKRRKKERAEDTNYYTSIDEPKGSPNYTYIDVDLDNVGYSEIPNNGTGVVTKSGEKSKNAMEIEMKNPKLLESNEKCKGTKYARKRSVPNENVDDEKVRESSQYTYIDSSKIRPDEPKPAAFATDNIGPNSQTGKLTPQYSKVGGQEEDVYLDNYNHVGLNEPPPRDPDAEDLYNHIDSNVKFDNSFPKGSNSKPTSNYSYADVDLSEDDVLDDTYDRAQYVDGINQQAKKERNVKDTYHRIGIKNDNSVSKGDNYNHIDIEFPESDDTYNHTHSDNKSTPHPTSDNYHHINL